jgi:hypothetical protein
VVVRFHCESCNAWFQAKILSERALGKRVIAKCKRCGKPIPVDVPADAGTSVQGSRADAKSSSPGVRPTPPTLEAVPPPTARPPSLQCWHLQVGETVRGPIDTEDILVGILAGEFGPDTLVRRNETSPWALAGQTSPFAELFERPAVGAPETVPPPVQLAPPLAAQPSPTLQRAEDLPALGDIKTERFRVGPPDEARTEPFLGVPSGIAAEEERGAARASEASSESAAASQTAAAPAAGSALEAAPEPVPEPAPTPKLAPAPTPKPKLATPPTLTPVAQRPSKPSPPQPNQPKAGKGGALGLLLVAASVGVVAFWMFTRKPPAPAESPEEGTHAAAAPERSPAHPASATPAPLTSPGTSPIPPPPTTPAPQSSAPPANVSPEPPSGAPSPSRPPDPPKTAPVAKADPPKAEPHHPAPMKPEPPKPAPKGEPPKPAAKAEPPKPVEKIEPPKPLVAKADPAPPPPPAGPSATVPGDVSAEEGEALAETLAKAVPSIRQCAMIELKRLPAGVQLGSLELGVTIASSSAISDVTAGPARLDKPLLDCARGAVRRLSFKPFAGSAVTLRRTVALDRPR